MLAHFKAVLAAHRRMSHATVHDSHALLFYSSEDFLSRTIRLHADEIGFGDNESFEGEEDVLDLCEKEMRICEKQIVIYQRSLNQIRKGCHLDGVKKLMVTLRYLITKENEWVDMLFRIALGGLSDCTYSEAHSTFCKNYQNRCWAFDQLIGTFGPDFVRFFKAAK